MKRLALILMWLAKMCNLMSYRYSAAPVGILGAALAGIKAELVLTGDRAVVEQINAMGEEIEKNLMIYRAKRATAVNPEDEVK